MEERSVKWLVNALGGKLLGDDPEALAQVGVTAVDTDSRKLRPGSLFIPLVGERFDGHAYIDQALTAGAAGCLTEKEPERLQPGKFYIQVPSTHQALRDLAVAYKAEFDVPVVAVTGSVGKTTAKDMIAAVLGEKYTVLKTEGNFNNDIGLPLTLLRLEKKHQMAVVELGINHPGEMDYLSGIAQPDVVVITNIGDSHIEAFGCRENTLKAKLEIFNHAIPGCTAVLNGDDPLLRGAEEDINTRWTGSVLYVGRSEGQDYRASEVESDGKSRMTCRIDTPRGGCRVEVPALGEHMVYPILLAAAVGERFDMTLPEIAAGIAAFSPTKMRMNILPRAQDITILDDGYNANPQSMRAAIDVLDNYSGSYKIAVLGDMFELGALAGALHAGVGEFLKGTKVDSLIAIGPLAKSIRDAAQGPGGPECRWFQTKEEALPALGAQLRPGATVLVKASRGMAFETITEYLKSITEEA